MSADLDIGELKFGEMYWNPSDDNADGISKHRLVSYIAHYHTINV